MEISELYTQINNCRKFLDGFYEKMILILKYIKTQSLYPIGSNAWNRFNYYEDSLSLMRCDWINGLQIPIAKFHIPEGEAKGYCIGLEMVSILGEGYTTGDTFKGWLLFLFTCQKDSFIDLNSWINPKDNNWISKTLTETYFIQKNKDEKCGIFESFLLVHALPLEKFFSQEKNQFFINGN